jgi:eukaryotic-like serine/threonine-protein kinase
VLRDGRPVLLDFGSARPLGAEQIRGKLIGSPGYAAPDLEAGEPISAEMDVFGVGVTLWEARAGEPPFEPDLAAAARPVLDLAADSPVGQAIARFTAPDPRDRPDVDTALATLARWIDPDGKTVWPWFARA